MRKTLVLLLMAQGLWLSVFSQYWQQQVNYTIDVTLHDKDNSLDAFEKIEYINNSPDTLKFIWFHLWPNAYKNDRTAFSDQALVNGDTRFYFSDKEQKGYINRLDFKVHNITCDIEDHPLYIDVVKVVLPAPLAPGQNIVLSTPFHVQLPYNFSRGGHDGESYQATQWYPKPAVYDRNGWHPMPYLEQGEYYSEFGSFDVRITVPKNYVVAATGELQDQDEKKWLLTRKDYFWQPLKKRTKSKGGIVKTTIQKFPPSPAETKTLRYTQSNIHDFAWFADKRFIVDQDTCRLSSGKIIEVFTYYTNEQKETWKNSVQYAKQALRFYSSQIGEYPYDVVSAVQGPQSFGGGMEYPTITVISPAKSAKELDITMAHELGHNWFYGVIGSNERDHPWMDEGINSFYEDRYLLKYYSETPYEERTIFEAFAKEGSDQPIETTSAAFSEENYGLVAYYKTTEWLRWMEEQIGKSVFDSSMKNYYRQWKFRHPQPEDFKQAMQQGTGIFLDSTFGYLSKKGTLPNLRRSGTKAIFLFKPGFLKSFLDNRDQNLFTISPSIGLNSYDKFMAGIFLSNVKLPLNNFKFFMAPMYAFGSKRFTGLGKLDYSLYPSGAFGKVDLFVNGSTFTENDFADSTGRKLYLSFRKVVPGIRFTLRRKDPLSHVYRYIQWKTFLVTEDELRFSQDTLLNPPGVVTRVTKTKQERTLHQLLLAVDNARALYPYRGQLKIEQGKDFARAAFTGNYFFNYPKDGGLNVRFFAGKFFYTTAKTISKEFATERYHLNLTGANGYQDYTFSDYFIGRNKFDGLASQQIMMRDGGFKVQTDLLASPVGQTDNWLMAVNFVTSIPPRINPLNILPVKIPLYAFLDIGTSAEAWKKNAESDHFLFDGGFQLSLFKNTINIYVPLVYSNVYKSYIQSILEKKNRFFRKISFSIDLSSFSLKTIDKNLSF